MSRVRRSLRRSSRRVRRSGRSLRRSRFHRRANLRQQWLRGRTVPRAGERGQASVELVAVIPLVVSVGFAVFSLLAAAAAGELAAQAAEAGAVAMLQDRNPEAAAREALPDGARKAARIAVKGRRITVEVPPRGPVPAINAQLVAHAAADAGPVPGR
jgi:hypothetical protein